MSLKEDIDGVKQEIDNEEKFLTAFVKVEKFIKKYKIVLISAVAAIVVGGIGYQAYGYYERHRIAQANEAYLKLMKNPADAEALALLKSKSAPLYEAYMLQMALGKGDKATLEAVSGSKNRVLADIAVYEAALASGNTEKLAAYAANKESFYKDIALFVLANKQIQKNEYKKARETLSKIPADSAIKEYANYLYHSVITFN